MGSKKKFDSKAAKKFLVAREEAEKNQREKERKTVLKKVISVIKKEFEGSCVEVYLIGSILQPFLFSSRSDVDVVLKNYEGDRFDFWTKLETELGRKVEVIVFETCRFQEFVLSSGLKVI